MDPASAEDVEQLLRREVRAPLPFLKVLRLYLDPFALFKNVNAGDAAAQAGAAEYNRRHRRMLLTYARRWSIIAAACMASVAPLVGAAVSEPILCVPFLGLELGFSIGLCSAVLSVAVYVVLGLEPGGHDIRKAAGRGPNDDPNSAP
jgi:hypothetical protein